MAKKEKAEDLRVCPQCKVAMNVYGDGTLKCPLCGYEVKPKAEE